MPEIFNATSDVDPYHRHVGDDRCIKFVAHDLFYRVDKTLDLMIGWCDLVVCVK